MISGTIKPKGSLVIEMIGLDGEVEKTINKQNMVTAYGTESLGILMMTGDVNRTIKYLVYGDGAVGKGKPNIRIPKLYNKKGQTDLVSYIVQGVVEQTMTMLFKIKPTTDSPVIINEFGLLTKEQKLFAFVQMLPSETLLLEPGKQINIYWKYNWI